MHFFRQASRHRRHDQFEDQGVYSTGADGTETDNNDSAWSGSQSSRSESRNWTPMQEEKRLLAGSGSQPSRRGSRDSDCLHKFVSSAPSSQSLLSSDGSSSGTTLWTLGILHVGRRTSGDGKLIAREETRFAFPGSDYSHRKTAMKPYLRSKTAAITYMRAGLVEECPTKCPQVRLSPLPI